MINVVFIDGIIYHYIQLSGHTDNTTNCKQ